LNLENIVIATQVLLAVNMEDDSMWLERSLASETFSEEFNSFELENYDVEGIDYSQMNEPGYNWGEISPARDEIRSGAENSSLGRTYSSTALAVHH
jgi:hypothetical protein